MRKMKVFTNALIASGKKIKEENMINLVIDGIGLKLNLAIVYITTKLGYLF